MKSIIYLTILVISGCCPVLYTKHPGFSGRIIDAQTQTPVEGVQINLKRYRYNSETGNTNFVVASTTTDESGNFYIKAPKGLGIYIMPMDIFSVHYKLDMTSGTEKIGSHDYYHRALRDTHFHELNEITFEPEH